MKEDKEKKKKTTKEKTEPKKARVVKAKTEPKEEKKETKKKATKAKTETKKTKVVKAKTEPKEEKKETKKNATKAKTETKKTKVVKAKAEPKEEKKETKKVVKIKEETKKEEKASKVVKVKEEKCLLEKKDQKPLKILSKIISVFSKIARIFLMVVLPFVLLAMAILPIVFKNFEVDGNIIKLDDVRLVYNDSKFVVKVADNIYTSEGNSVELQNIFNFLSDSSKTKIIVFFEIALAFAAASIVILIYLLANLEKVFFNIHSKETPFIDENSKIILTICHLMIAFLAVSLVSNVVISAFINCQLTATSSTITIFDILITYVIYFVYKYAVKLQKKTDSTIYD